MNLRMSKFEESTRFWDLLTSTWRRTQNWSRQLKTRLRSLSNPTSLLRNAQAISTEVKQQTQETLMAEDSKSLLLEAPMKATSKTTTSMGTAEVFLLQATAMRVSLTTTTCTDMAYTWTWRIRRDMKVSGREAKSKESSECMTESGESWSVWWPMIWSSQEELTKLQIDWLLRLIGKRGSSMEDFMQSFH